jgi:transcriptional regulator with XRE-family HTH domain
MTTMNSLSKEILEIATRIKELREICDVSEEELANEVGVSLEQYRAYESGSDDIPVGVIYAVSRVLGVDSTAIITGSDAKMTDYTVVRKGNGTSIERYPGYRFSSLAMNYIGRDMNPMLITMKKEDEEPELVTHGGQEFNYCLEGKVVVTIGAKKITLEPGDSIYFNPAIPHGQRALDGDCEFLTVINE